MPQNLIARASVTIAASAAKVWDALTNPKLVKQYMFGTEVDSDFREGSPIRWKGEFKGKPYEDRGTIKRAEPRRLLEYSHQSGASQSTHTVKIELAEKDGKTELALSQDQNPSEDAREHSEKNWKTMLASMKKLLEQPAPA